SWPTRRSISLRLPLCAAGSRSAEASPPAVGRILRSRFAHCGWRFSLLLVRLRPTTGRSGEFPLRRASDIGRPRKSRSRVCIEGSNAKVLGSASFKHLMGSPWQAGIGHLHRLGPVSLKRLFIPTISSNYLTLGRKRRGVIVHQKRSNCY